MSAASNIVLIHWHDVGRHLGTYGAQVHTPNLDRMAAAGTLFEQAFSAAPLCSPARGALMTGRYPHSNGLNGLVHLGWEYHSRERTIAHLLNGADYDTALIGLQHESRDDARLGYRHVVNLGTGDDDPPYCGPVTDAAISWLNARGNANNRAPFFLTVGFYETHRPYPTSRYRPADPATVTVPPYLPDNEWTRDDLASFQGAIRTADAAVGRLLACLDQQPFAPDTWVVFTTDHGIAFPRAKSTLYEPGVGVAFIVRPPAGVAAQGRTRRLFSHVDVLPTFLEILGIAGPGDLQGVSHAAFLLDGDQAPARQQVFCEKTYHDDYDPMRSVRTADWTYIRSFEPRPRLPLPLDLYCSPTARGYGSDHLEHRPDEELYDLRVDPHERCNLAGEPRYQSIRDRMAAALLRWQEDTRDPLLHGRIPPSAVPRLPKYGALAAADYTDAAEIRHNFSY
jgi:arylsulfatase A-like enzyme